MNTGDRIEPQLDLVYGWIDVWSTLSEPWLLGGGLNCISYISRTLRLDVVSKCGYFFFKSSPRRFLMLSKLTDFIEIIGPSFIV